MEEMWTWELWTMQCACMRSVLRVLQPSTQEQMCRQVTRAGCAYMTSLRVSWLRAFFYLLRVSRFCVLFFKKRTFLDTCQRPSHLYSIFIFHIQLEQPSAAPADSPLAGRGRARELIDLTYYIF